MNADRSSTILTTGWRTALREFAVIVAGVLVALAAQAWWEGGQERERERDYLRLLLQDTRENARRLEPIIAGDSVGAAAIRRAMTALRSPAPLPPADTVARWILAAGRSEDFQPLTGTYDALMATGDIRLVRNDSLRARIVAYAGDLESEVQRLDQLRVATLDLVPPLAAGVPFLQGVFVGPVDVQAADLERIRSDPQAMSTLFAFQAVGANRMAALRRIRERTAELAQHLEAVEESRGR